MHKQKSKPPICLKCEVQKPAETVPTQILKECLAVHISRDRQYGTSEKNFANIAKIATRLSLDKTFNALDIAVIMVATKEARYKYQCQLLLCAEEEDDDITNSAAVDAHDTKVLHDSIIDWINYLAIMENIRSRTKN